MPTRQWGDHALGTNEHSSYGLFIWTNSPRVGGKLQLKSNAHTRNKGQVFQVERGPGYQLRGASRGLDFLYPAIYNKHVEQLYSKTYGKFRSDIYDGSAALGVTIASYKQSREMIVKRSRQVVDDVNDLYYRWKYLPTSKREAFASTVLEVMFGWKPLVADMQAACMTVIQKADDFHFVKRRSHTVIREITPPNWTKNSMGYGKSAECRMSVGLSSGVRVSNPNLWLAERAGLLNAASVAWDLVPYSFIINMFVNTGQIINSITDFVGLEFSGPLRTIKFDGVYTYEVGYDWPGYQARSQWYNNQKYQESTSFPTPSLTLKLPKADWSLAVIASALAVQKAQSLKALLPKRLTG